ncbi:unnamed protein product [Gongylonema pulchrum]|uniref:RUN domain-containing protein n=1 Tax=Gongylonema pulchrum TaxID=637853 RepID=A0A183EF99_9BILA|nr:unnamed protein product [Gongylonema pulchrum]
MPFSAHPLRTSWRSIRSKVRVCRQTEYDVAHAIYYLGYPQAAVVRPRFMTNFLEQQFYEILITFLDKLIESPFEDLVKNNIWACKKFGRQLAGVLRAVNFDQEYCWQLLENRVLYYLILKNYGISMLLAWHTFINALSDAVMEGFWQAACTDLPRQLPTIFEDTPTRCFFQAEQTTRQGFLSRLLNLIVGPLVR